MLLTFVETDVASKFISSQRGIICLSQHSGIDQCVLHLMKTPFLILVRLLKYLTLLAQVDKQPCTCVSIRVKVFHLHFTSMTYCLASLLVITFMCKN